MYSNALESVQQPKTRFTKRAKNCKYTTERLQQILEIFCRQWTPLLPTEHSTIRVDSKVLDFFVRYRVAWHPKCVLSYSDHYSIRTSDHHYFIHIIYWLRKAQNHILKRLLFHWMPWKVVYEEGLCWTITWICLINPEISHGKKLKMTGKTSDRDHVKRLWPNVD